MLPAPVILTVVSRLNVPISVRAVDTTHSPPEGPTPFRRRQSSADTVRLVKSNNTPSNHRPGKNVLM
jgi:hypothetical protein